MSAVIECMLWLCTASMLPRPGLYLVEPLAIRAPFGYLQMVTAGNLQATLGRPSQPSEISTYSLDDIGTDGPDPSDGTGTPATSNDSNNTDMVMCGPSLGVDLMGMPQQDSAHMEPCHSFDSDASPRTSRSCTDSPLSIRDGRPCAGSAPSPLPCPPTSTSHHLSLPAGTRARPWNIVCMLYH